MEHAQQQPGQTPVPAHLLEEAARLRAAGMNVGFPVILQFDEKALAMLAKQGTPQTFGQELGRFAAKAGVAAVGALAVGLTYHYITAPPAMDGMA